MSVRVIQNITKDERVLYLEDENVYVNSEGPYYFYQVGQNDEYKLFKGKIAFAILAYECDYEVPSHSSKHKTYGFRYFNYLVSNRKTKMVFCGDTPDAAIKNALTGGRKVMEAETFMDIARYIAGSNC